MFVSSNRKNLVEVGSKYSNSRQQFVAALNGRFETAENLLDQNCTAGRPLKQAKLSNGYFIKKPQSAGRFNTSVFTPKAPRSSEYLLMPLPQSKTMPSVQIKGSLNRTIDVVDKDFHVDYLVGQDKPSPVKESVNNSVQNGRNKMALVGRVDFCLKIHKLYPTLDALWDVYGQLKKIIRGKQRGENVLLLRNSDGGPILQSIYYDFTLDGYDSGCYLRAVGRFIGENRLQTFKLQRIEEDEYMQLVRYFNRLQNVSSFALLQSGN
ncbi:uncharacterized protein LOC105213384 [Zeugodacus cucurbitae]|uniref:uncharacterized protein LOC105213384 n=1 Tax=Zeugodacus cucurbitae TaxID=28588 RepID=UPI0005969005|nr:uncharacterized protein LOC105213384 [Zeugodacus cucurbitae]